MGALNKIRNIGTLDRRVTLRTFSTSRTDTGAEEVSYSDGDTVWASVEPVSRDSDEDETGGNRITATTRLLFVIRYRSDVEHKMRLKYNGDEYDIKVINEVGRRRFLSMECELRE